MLQCKAHGHELVCLSTLYHADGDECDSFMYQSVGARVVPLIAKCMGLPLIRQEMSTNVSEDLLADLRQLMHKVKRDYPQVDAVSIGAIKSNYQRQRMEHVMVELGIVPLCFMWCQPQSLLLEHILMMRMEVAIVKVACMGLTRDDLGTVIDHDMLQKFQKMHDQFGMNVCGEGGEYETTVLNCPLLYRHGRVQLGNFEFVTHSDDAFAPVHYLKFAYDRLQICEPSAVIEELNGSLYFVSTPRVPYSDVVSLEKESTQIHVETVQRQVHKARSSQSCVGSYTVRTGITELNDVCVMAAEIVMTQLVLRDLPSQFATINSQYKLAYGGKADIVYLDGHEPSVRACVGSSCNAEPYSLDVLAYRQPTEGITLSKLNKMHVQSRSYWAPSNIGPYSQMITVPSTLMKCTSKQTNVQLGRVFVAGQIGLVPHTMKLADGVVNQLKYAWSHIQSVLSTGLFDSDSSAFASPQLTAQELYRKSPITSLVAYTTSATDSHTVVSWCNALMARDNLPSDAPFICAEIDALPMVASVELVAECVDPCLTDLTDMRAAMDQMLDEQGVSDTDELCKSMQFKYEVHERENYTEYRITWNKCVVARLFTGHGRLPTMFVDSVLTSRLLAATDVDVLQGNTDLANITSVLSCKSLLDRNGRSVDYALLVTHAFARSLPKQFENVVVLRSADDNLLTELTSASSANISFVEVLEFATCGLQELNSFLMSIDDRNVIVSSARAVESLYECLSTMDAVRRSERRMACHVVGKNTARKLQELAPILLEKFCIRLEIVLVAESALELAQMIVDSSPPELSFTFFCGSTRMETLPSRLTASGHHCQELIVYESKPAILTPVKYKSDTLLLAFSPLGVTAMIEALQSYENITWLAIGKTTALTIKKLVPDAHVIVPEHSNVESMVAKIKSIQE